MQKLLVIILLGYTTTIFGTPITTAAEAKACITTLEQFKRRAYMLLAPLLCTPQGESPRPSSTYQIPKETALDILGLADHHATTDDGQDLMSLAQSKLTSITNQTTELDLYCEKDSDLRDNEVIAKLLIRVSGLIKLLSNVFSADRTNIDSQIEIVQAYIQEESGI